jgi:lia operon protein LiaG
MNTMKYVIPILLAVSITGRLSAQEYKVTVENTKDARLELNDFPGDFSIEGYAGTEIIITTDGGDFAPPERAKGLKPVYGGGTDNTGIALYMEKNGNNVSFRCLLPTHRSATYHLKVPENLALKIHQECNRSGTTTIQSMKNEVDYDGCQEVNLKNVTGPLVVSTVNGGVNVVFSEISKDKPISIASVNGEVDVTIPANAAVNLVMSNVNGNMYSDFDLPQDSKSMRRVGGSTVRATLNGGGTDLKLSGINGNVYLRKGQTNKS